MCNMPYLYKRQKTLMRHKEKQRNERIIKLHLLTYFGGCEDLIVKENHSGRS